MLLVDALLTDGHADIHSAQQREDEGLDEGHQELHQTHEDVEENGDRGDGQTDGRVHLPEDENQGNEGQRDDVAGSDVGKKSHHQHERLGEDTDGLHQRHDGQREFQPPRHTRKAMSSSVSLFSQIICSGSSNKSLKLTMPLESPDSQRLIGRMVSHEIRPVPV